MIDRSIFISEYDHSRLLDLIREARRGKPEQNRYLDDLENELTRAQLVTPQQVPPDVITMNTTAVLADVDSSEEQTVTLVFPADADPLNDRISVLAPIGTAMLGYRVGDTFTWQVPDGTRRLLVKQIVYQPEASGDYHL
jgi:regulator of nucleoside diphosphate kinase